jgi:signal transduction histidine kinase
LDNYSDFLPSDGELADLIRAFDWAVTPLGPCDQWPASLKTVLNIVLTSNHPMFIWWERDLIQFYNDAYRKTMGPERHPSALGQPGRECWQEIWPIIGPQIESIMTGGASTWHEDQLVPVTRNGKLEEVWWTYSYSPICDAAGVRGVLVICNDVTKEHLVKAELAREVSLRRHEAEHLKVLFQQAPGFACVLRSPQHICEFANNAYLRLVGNREIVGKSVREALPEIEEQGFLELLDQVFATGNPFFAQDVPISLRSSPGSSLTQLFLDFVYQPIAEPDGTISGIFVAGSDVTERKCAEEKLREADQRKNEFVAMLAHELRNPLAPISAAAELLSSIRQDDVRIKQASDIITRQVGHMNHMINGLLDITSIAHGTIALDKDHADVGILLSEAVEQVRPLLERRAHQLILPQTAGSFLVLGDRKRLIQVIANLLNNAAKYTPEGGVIQVHLESSADDVVLAIQDNGIGMEQEMLPHVFEMFAQAKRPADGAVGGLGIGLSLVKGLVVAHGGRITVASNGLGTGTKVTVVLPHRAEESASAV